MYQTEDGLLITNCKLSGKKRSCSSRENTLELAWRDWGNPRKISISITDILDKHSPIISLERYGWKNQLRELREEQVKGKAIPVNRPWRPIGL
jgi:hypothetical protein